MWVAGSAYRQDPPLFQGLRVVRGGLGGWDLAWLASERLLLGKFIKHRGS